MEEQEKLDEMRDFVLNEFEQFVIHYSYVPAEVKITIMELIKDYKFILNMKTYTEEQVRLAMEYQKAECYQIVGGYLINDVPNIVASLDYLANDLLVPMGEVDSFIESYGKY